MRDKTMEDKIRHSLGAELSGLRTASGQRERLFEYATGGYRMKRRIPAAAVLLAALLLMTVTAIALTSGFGILEYHPEQSANQAYADHVMTLHQTWEGAFFSATLHEAVFDGMQMSFTMSIVPREGADPVFVIPRITAVSGDRKLNTFTTHSSVVSGEGFWVPCMEPGVVCDFDHVAADVILTDDFNTFSPTADEVTWEITFDVLHTDWPIGYTAEDEPMIGDEEWTDEEYAEYDLQFAEAYAEGRVLLNRAAMLSPFAAAIPHDPTLEDEMDYPDYIEMLLTPAVFALEERVTFSFAADPLPVKHAKQPVSFELPGGLQAQVTSLSVSVDQVGLSLRITKPGSDQPLRLEDWQDWQIAVFARGAETSFPEVNYGPEEDGSLQYNAHWIITGGTDQLTLLPVEADSYAEVMASQGAVTEEQRARIIRIDLE